MVRLWSVKPTASPGLGRTLWDSVRAGHRHFPPRRCWSRHLAFQYYNKRRPRGSTELVDRGGNLREMTKGEQLLEDFRRQRRAGDPRITPEGREILLRITKGDLAGEFAESLAAITDADPMLSGRADPGDDLD